MEDQQQTKNTRKVHRKCTHSIIIPGKSKAIVIACPFNFNFNSNLSKSFVLTKIPKQRRKQMMLWMQIEQRAE